MKYLVHQTLQIEADSTVEAARMAIEIQQNRRDFPHCNSFTVHWAEGDVMKGHEVNIPLATPTATPIAPPVAQPTAPPVTNEDVTFD